MNPSRKTHVFVHFPSTGEVYDGNVIFEETIFQFTSRILQSLNINYSDDFHLYMIDQKCRCFKPEGSCSSLFGIRCNQLVLTRAVLTNVDLFFENFHYNVVYDVSAPAMNFIDNAIHLLQSSSTKFTPPLTKKDLKNCYFTLYDPVADNIIRSNAPLNTSFVVLKRFEYIAPGYVFDFSISKGFYGKLTNCSLESNIICNFIKQVRSYHRREHLSGIDYIEFTEERAQFLFESFRNKLFDKNEVTLSEQINFLFTVLSLAKQPYIPSSLRKLIVYAMGLEDDRKIFNIAKAIALYLPLSTHLVLEELFQLFGTATVDEESWNNISMMLTEVLFDPKTEDSEENYDDDIEDKNIDQYVYESADEKEEREGEMFFRFTRFMLLFFKQIFNLNENIGRKNSIRMVKKIPKSDSKSSLKGKKEKKVKADKKAKKKLDTDSDEIPNDTQNDTEFEQKHSKSDRKKKDNKILAEIQNNDDTDTDFGDKNKRSKSWKKPKIEKKNKYEVKSDDEALIKKGFSLDDDEEKIEMNDIDHDNYSFYLYEEMKSNQMIMRNIDGFVDINIDETTEFVSNESLFDLLNSLVHQNEVRCEEQDISAELDQLNDIIRILKVKFNSAVFADQTPSPNSKERKQPSLIL